MPCFLSYYLWLIFLLESNINRFMSGRKVFELRSWFKAILHAHIIVVLVHKTFSTILHNLVNKTSDQLNKSRSFDAKMVSELDARSRLLQYNK